MIDRFPSQHNVCAIEEEEQLDIVPGQCRASPSHLEAYCDDSPVESADNCADCASNTISATASATATEARLSSPLCEPGEVTHGLPLLQEDSVEAWASGASTTLFEFLGCGTAELQNLYYDEDYYCDIWEDCGACTWAYGVPMGGEVLHDTGLAAGTSPEQASSSSLTPTPSPPPPPPPPPPPAPPPVAALPSSSSPSLSPTWPSSLAAGAVEIREAVRENGTSKLRRVARPLGKTCSAAVSVKTQTAGPSALQTTKTAAFKTRRTKPVPVSIEELRAVYHMPREDAASSLQIGCTFLKKICRMYGIKRWPSRKLAALNNHITELGRLCQRNAISAEPLIATHSYSELDAEVHENLELAINHAEDTRQKIYQDPNCAITRDLYRELQGFRKQCGMG